MEIFRPLVQGLIDGAYYVNPQDGISKGVAHALYGVELENSATGLDFRMKRGTLWQKPVWMKWWKNPVRPFC